MRIAYLTTFYTGAVDGRFGRFHDWMHTLRATAAEDAPFDSTVVALTVGKPDATLSSVPLGLLGDGDSLWATKRNTLAHLANLRRARRDLRAADPDVVHTLRLDIPSLLAARAVDAPLVIGPDVQGYYPRRAGWPDTPANRLRYRAKRWFASTVPDARFVTLSDYHAGNVASLGVDPDRIDVLPPGVDARFAPMASDGGDRGPVHYLYVGDLTDYKGFPVFCDALHRLSGAWTATAVGDGRHALDERPADIDVRRAVPRWRLPRYYNEADVFVCPSTDEHGPNTVVEALACGTPVVATDRPGINEYADAAAEYATRTPEAFADAMRHVANDLPRYRRAARRHAPQYRAEVTLDGLADTYARA